MPRADETPRESARVVCASTTESWSDAELVERVRTGDRWAFGALFRRHAPRVATVATRLLGDKSEAEDVVQEAFLAAFERLDTLSDPTSFRAWILRIAVHRVHRRFRRWRMFRALGIVRGANDAMLHTAASPTLGPEGRAELARLDRVLATMPHRERIAWMLRHVEGYSLAETAELCQCSLATAKRRIGAAAAKVDAHVRFEDAEAGDE